MIRFSHLSKRFGKFTAVDDLSFEVEDREAISLWGPNGAGKTTVIKCLLGLLGYDGEIVVDGLDARKKGREVRRLLGYVPQELSFYDDMNTIDMARYFAQLKKMPQGRTSAVLEQVGLAEHQNKPVGALSGGMKQRLALGLALLADPPILVLDEPTSNLDTEARDQFLGLLSDVRAGGKTIIFTSHRLEEIETLADRVLVLNEGSIQFTCAAPELAQRLGMRMQVILRVAPEKMESALDLLRAEGMTARQNGVGLLVDVAPGEKIRPIQVLSKADITIQDFEVE